MNKETGQAPDAANSGLKGKRDRNLGEKNLMRIMTEAEAAEMEDAWLRERTKGVTSENCPYFHAITWYGEKIEGIQTAYVDQIQVLTFHALDLGIQETPKPLDFPDQIMVWPGNMGDSYEVSVKSAVFFVSESGHLCFETWKPRKLLRDGTIEGEAGREAWVLLERPNGEQFQDNGAYRNIPLIFPYKRVCNAVKARNKTWGIEPSDELRKALAYDWTKYQTAPTLKARFPSKDGIAMLPNLGADRDLHRSFMSYPYQWLTDENLCVRAFDGRENTVVYQPSEVEKLLQDAPAKALEMLEKRFGEIKNETVPDVIDILFHHWHRHHDPKTNASLITAAQICKYRGVVPKGANLNLHWHALQDAFSMSLRERTGDLNAEVFFFETVGEKLGTGAAYAYSPGFMLQYALRGETLYFAPFMERIWELDPKKNNEAKRIARYMRGDWRMNTEKYLTAESGQARAARYHTWAHILHESGIDVEFHRNSPNPSRLITALEKAVETLYEMEVLEETGFAIYHSQDRETAENLPRKGRLDAWLALRVCLAPAADVREALLETDSKRRAGRARDAAALSKERAKKVLKSELKRPKR